MMLRQNFTLVIKIYPKVLSLTTHARFPTLFTPTFHFVYTDISAISVTFCSSVSVSINYHQPASANINQARSALMSIN